MIIFFHNARFKTARMQREHDKSNVYWFTCGTSGLIVISRIHRLALFPHYQWFTLPQVTCNLFDTFFLHQWLCLHEQHRYRTHVKQVSYVRERKIYCSFALKHGTMTKQKSILDSSNFSRMFATKWERRKVCYAQTRYRFAISLT